MVVTFVFEVLEDRARVLAHQDGVRRIVVNAEIAGDAVLLAPCFGKDQRYVDLTFTLSAGTVKATAPANGSVAPPGYYMLVIVNSSGIPSIMPFLNLD